MHCVDSFKQFFKCECYQTFCIMGNLTQATMADLTFLDSLFSIHAGIENRELLQESRLTTDCQLTFEQLTVTV